MKYKMSRYSKTRIVFELLVQSLALYGIWHGGVLAIILAILWVFYEFTNGLEVGLLRGKEESTLSEKPSYNSEN